MRAKGYFISMEGIEGCGKSTQARRLAKRLREDGHKVLLTFEPGGTTIGGAIRGALLNSRRKVSALAEWLLFEADRAQHVREVIIPALRRGMVVICDRYSDSSRAYQGFGRGLGLAQVDRVDRLATGGVKPNLTILLDLPVREGLARARKRGGLTRIDRERPGFHERIRSAFLVLATREPRRIRVVDGRIGAREAGEAIYRHVNASLDRRFD